LPQHNCAVMTMLPRTCSGTTFCRKDRGQKVSPASLPAEVPGRPPKDTLALPSTPWGGISFWSLVQTNGGGTASYPGFYPIIAMASCNCQIQHRQSFRVCKESAAHNAITFGVWIAIGSLNASLTRPWPAESLTLSAMVETQSGLRHQHMRL